MEFEKEKLSVYERDETLFVSYTGVFTLIYMDETDLLEPVYINNAYDKEEIDEFIQECLEFIQQNPLGVMNDK